MKLKNSTLLSRSYTEKVTIDEFTSTKVTMMCPNCGRSFRPQKHKNGSLQPYCRNRDCQTSGSRSFLKENTSKQNELELINLIDEQAREIKAGNRLLSFDTNRSIKSSLSMDCDMSEELSFHDLIGQEDTSLV